MTAISGATVAAVSAGSAACSACSGKMLKLLFTLVVLTSLLTPQPVISIQVLPDGGYSGIVIKINEAVPEENCADILQKIQVSYNISTLGRQAIAATLERQQATATPNAYLLSYLSMLLG